MAAATAVAVALAGCDSAPTAGLSEGPPSFPLYKNGLATAFPGGTCGPATVGKPFTIFVVLTGGDPPYHVTWYVNGRPGGLDRVEITSTGTDTDPMYANGTKYTITFTRRSPHDKVTFRALDYRKGVLMEKTEVPAIGGASPCPIEP